MQSTEKSAQKLRRAPQARRLKTRQKVLDSARALILESGFESAKTQDIARLAGVAEGSIFAHFGTKQGLLIGLMEDHYDFLTKGVQSIMATHENPKLQLVDLIEFHLENLLESWELVRVFAHYGRYEKTPTAKAFRRLNRDYTRAFLVCIEDLKVVGFVKSDLPTDLLRDMIFGSSEHWVFRAKEFDRALEVKAAVDFLIKRVMS